MNARTRPQREEGRSWSRIESPYRLMRFYCPARPARREGDWRPAVLPPSVTLLIVLFPFAAGSPHRCFRSQARVFCCHVDDRMPYHQMKTGLERSRVFSSWKAERQLTASYAGEPSQSLVFFRDRQRRPTRGPGRSRRPLRCHRHARRCRPPPLPAFARPSSFLKRWDHSQPAERRPKPPASPVLPRQQWSRLPYRWAFPKSGCKACDLQPARSR